MFSEINSHEYDFPPIHDKNSIKNYVIASTPRSGSTLLGKLLWETKRAGAPHEYFHDKHSKDYLERWKINSLEEYVQHLHRYRSSENGIFGIKLHFHQLQNFNLAPLELNRIFDYPQFVFIKRRNKILQAISFAKALQTKQWALCVGEQLKIANYDFNQIDQALRQLEAEEEKWEAFLNANIIDYKTVYYEDFIEDIQGSLKDVMNYLEIQDVEMISVKPSIVKMADEKTMEWLDRFLKEKELKCNL